MLSTFQIAMDMHLTRRFSSNVYDHSCYQFVVVLMVILSRGAFVTVVSFKLFFPYDLVNTHPQAHPTQAPLAINTTTRALSLVVSMEWVVLHH